MNDPHAWTYEQDHVLLEGWKQGMRGLIVFESELRQGGYEISLSSIRRRLLHLRLVCDKQAIFSQPKILRAREWKNSPPFFNK